MPTSSEEQYIVAVGEQAKTARQSAGKGASIASGPSIVRLGLVAGVSAGQYTVGVLAADGTYADSIPGVTAWGDTMFEAGDKVMLIWLGDRPIPFIVGTGGGTGGSLGAGVSIANRFFSS